MSEITLTAGVTGLGWLGGTAAFALGDGTIAGVEGPLAQVHDGAVLCAASHPDGQGLITGGDDGRLCLTRASGAVCELVAAPGKWIEHVAASPASGVIVAGAGRQAIVFKPGSTTPNHRFEHPSTIGGLALDARGRRLAVSCYGGAILRYALMADDPGSSFKWAGSHLAATLSPDAEFIITAMQELGLHGWRVADRKDLRMSGYAAKTRSFSWDRRGRWLATSGADCAVLWPFTGKDGPMGKPPLLIAQREALATQVAFHPSADLIAIGYSDGAVSVARLEAPPATQMCEPGGGAVTALAWSPDGAWLAAGTAEGRAVVRDVA